jgi:hypothetical protein
MSTGANRRGIGHGAYQIQSDWRFKENYQPV